MILSIMSQNKLMQFLMGLNESYDAIKSQILVLDPLFTVNKSYSMVLKVEKQRAVQVNLLENIDSSAMMVKETQPNHNKGQGRQ